MKTVSGDGMPAEFDASCFDGVYVTGDISVQDIERLGVSRQLAQAAVDADDEPADTAPVALPDRG